MRSANRDDGAIAILVAVLSVVLFGFGAIVVDLGFARTIKQQSQDSAAAAALAGAQDLNACSARRCFLATQHIRSSARDNFDTTPSEWSGCRATAPSDGNLSTVTWRQRRSGTSCIQYGFQAGDSKPTLVFVSMPLRDSPSFLGGIFGYSGSTLGASSVAGLIATQVPPCALCVLETLSTDNGAVDVSGGGSLYATNAQGSGGQVDVTGGGTYLTNPTSSSASFTPPPVVTDRPIRDPLAPGSHGAPPDNDSDQQDCVGGTLAPGTYKKQVTVDVSCSLAGIYVFEDQVDVVDGGSLSGTEVTISLEDHGELRVDGSGSLSLAGPAPGQQLTLVSNNDRALRIATDGLGGADVSITGNVYLPDAELRVDSGTASVDGTTVANDITVTAGELSVQSAGRAVVRQQGRSDLGLVR